MILTDGVVTTKTVFHHLDFAGMHFNGFTCGLLEDVATDWTKYHLVQTYLCIVGETGGKDFM
ncbi:MAG: hypothetical protein ACMUEM_03515 [Flavobacteriales bacterium AspAUS03]